MKNLFKLFILLLFSVTGFSNSKSAEMKPLDLSAIKQVKFPNTQFYEVEHPKSQIVLHHTVSGNNIDGDVASWLSDSIKVATCVIVGRDGLINQLFSSKYYAYHLGLKANHFASNSLAYKDLNKTSIGIEIDSWGGLKNINGKWYASPNNFGTGNLKTKHGNIIKVEVPESDVIVYENGYKGYFGFEKYTNAQIDSCMQLLAYWNKTYNIPLNYNEDMWNVSKRALSGLSGVWTHTSFRPDKSDCHPQPELIKSLKNLV